MDDDFDRLVTPLDPAVVVVTVAAGGERSGCVVGFQSQCSIEPRRLAVWISNANHTHGVAMRASHLGVHVLFEQHRPTAELFGGTTGDEVDKFTRCAWSPGPFGVPLLDDCRQRGVFAIASRHDVGGDHDLFVLIPVDVAASDGGRVLRVGGLDIEPGHPAPG